MVCARCRRPLQHALHLAGMVVGRECRRAIVEAVMQPVQPEPQLPHPDQLDFFKAAGLFEAATEVRP